MMQNDRYVTDLPYEARFHREMTPVWLSTVLTALGRSAPDVTQPFDWCELGCGPGLALALTAAAHPQGRFVGLDINPDHVGAGRRLAEEAALANLSFVESGFQDMEAALAGHGRGFDFIVLHGVWSWIPDEDRSAVLGLIERSLKPGGIVYLHYMTHPGLSSFAAGQRFLRLHGRAGAGDSGDRALAGLGALKAFGDAGAGCFVADPDQLRRIEKALGESTAYLAHEFMNPHWEPLHVADVMEAMERAGCLYQGSATPIENIDAASLPERTQPLLRGMTDTALRETAKDLARNQTYRRDLYQKGGRALAPADHTRALCGQRLAGLPGAPSAGGLTFDTRIGPVEGAAALFDPLLRALAEAPQGFEELARRAGLTDAGLLNRAVQMLIWAGCAHPLQTAAVDPTPARRLNQSLARRAAARGEAGWLAAPALGSALPATADKMAALAG